MNIYEKIQKIKVELASSGIKPTGNNKHLNYKYYELGDFLPTLNRLLLDHKVSTRITFNAEKAELIAVNTEKPDEALSVESPMSTANLRNCHEVQNLGAVQTYLRRYLYTNMFDIVDRDILDGTITKEPLKSEETAKPPQGAPPQWDKMTEAQKTIWLNKNKQEEKQ